MLKRYLNLKRGNARQIFFTYMAVIAAFVILQLMIATGVLSSSMRGMLVPICAYMVMAISLNLVVGVLGELSLGHAGFMSIGAFSGVSAAIILQGVLPCAPLRLAAAIIIGAFFAAVAGFLIGIPVLRLKGDYLAIVTLAFGEIIKNIFNNFYLGIDSAGISMSMLTDKTRLLEGGRLIIAGPMGIGGIQKLSTFTAGFILTMAALVIVFNLVNSRSGRAFMAIRDDRIAAESVGINITRYKMMAFVTSAALAGAAGCLFAMNYSTIVANKFDFNTSILVLVFVVLGGQGNMLGSITAAAALTILPEKLRQFADYRMLLYAVVLIAVMLCTNNSSIREFVRRFAPRFGRAGNREGKDNGA